MDCYMFYSCLCLCILLYRLFLCLICRFVARQIKHLLGQQPLFAHQFRAQCFLRRQNYLVFGGKQLFMSVQHGVANDRLVFLGSQNDAHGGVVLRAALQFVVHAHVHVRLADVLVREFTGLQLKQHKQHKHFSR